MALFFFHRHISLSLFLRASEEEIEIWFPFSRARCMNANRPFPPPHSSEAGRSGGSPPLFFFHLQREIRRLPFIPPPLFFTKLDLVEPFFGSFEVG